MTEFEQELYELRTFSVSGRSDDDFEDIEGGAELDELPFEIPRD